MKRTQYKDAVTRLFTIITEFRGTTNVSQVTVCDEHDAVRAWAAKLRTERPFGRISFYLAKSIEADLGDSPPVAISGVANVWCIIGSCGGDFMLANIVETAKSTKDS